MRTTETYLRPIAIGVGIVTLAYVVYQLADVLMLVFGAIVVAAVLLAIAGLVQRVHRMPDRAAYSVALVVFLGVMAAAGWLAGAPLGKAIGQLIEQLPQAIDAARQWMSSLPFGNALLGALKATTSTGLPIGRVAGFTNLTLAAASGVFVIVLGGFYLAANPALYRRGFLRLLPDSSRRRVDAALVATGHKLRHWLAGQLVLMMTVGLLAGVGLTLLGVPGALGLGLLAMLTEFVPLIGPVMFGAIAILIAFTQGPRQALYVLLLVVAIQQCETHLLVPLVNRWATSLPPALAVTAIVAFGVLFGLTGIIFAVPLTIVIVSLVEHLYVEGLLRKPPRSEK
jgi:predicted PurR-regulated permease PerM